MARRFLSTRYAPTPNFNILAEPMEIDSNLRGVKRDFADSSEEPLRKKVKRYIRKAKRSGGCSMQKQKKPEKYNKERKKKKKKSQKKKKVSKKYKKKKALEKRLKTIENKKIIAIKKQNHKKAKERAALRASAKSLFI